MKITKRLKCLKLYVCLLAISASLNAIALSNPLFSNHILPPCTFTLSTNFTAPSCNAGTNGTATVTITGGSGNYSYTWSAAGQTGITATTLSAATYTVTVTDNTAACTDTATVTVTEPLPVINNTTGQPTSCFGYNDGKAWVTPTVSVPQPSYAWSGTSQQNDTLLGLTAADYTVTVTTNAGCTQSAVIVITQPTQLSGTVTSTNSTCNGANNGTATIIPAAGTPPYFYLWNSTPAQSTATATGLGPGIFTIKLSDSKGCEFYSTVSISEAAPLVISNPTITKETCQLGNGKISISLIGGTLPYTYAWSSPANLQTSSTAINLSAGSYTVTVTDSKGCNTTKSAVLTNQFISPTAFSSTADNLSCFGAADGKATVLASAGTSPYTYIWSPGGGVAVTASNLSPNIYTVVVTDANGCQATSTTVITQPAAMSLNTSSTNATCGLTDGSASVAPTGGTLPYNIVWSNAVIGNTANNLGAGTYTVTVTDGGPCTLTTSVQIILSNPLTITTNSTSITCNGLTDGTASVSASGGSGTFNYSWSPGGFTNASISNLAPTTYTLTVADALNAGCASTTTINITQPGILVPGIVKTDVTCNGLGNGQATSNPAGGTPPYTYIWSDGSATNFASGLAPNTYSLTVTDANACTATGIVTITESTALTVSLTSQTDVSCFGESTGSASANASGGTGTLTYAWSPSGGNASSASNLAEGNYTLTVNDANNCTATVAVVITQPSGITLASSVTPSSCGVSGGAATVTPSGGIGTYTYNWSSGISDDTSAVSSLASGTYTVTVSDANACSKTQTFLITVANPLLLTPAQINLTCNNSGDGEASVTTAGGTGSYNYLWAPGGAISSTITGLAAGDYTVTVMDAVNSTCTAASIISITQPALLSVTVTPTNIVCFGQTNGTVTAVPSGGTATYTYNWAAVAGTTSVLSNLGAGTYTVTITDANGCSTSESSTVIEPPILTLTITKKDVTCIGTYDGGVGADVIGGVPAYNYNWAPSGGALDTIGGLGPNTYTLTVTDANGCTRVDSAYVTEPPAFKILPIGINPTCYNTDGSVSVSVTGGSGSFSYLWTPSGSTAATVTGLAAGSYQIRVTDVTTGCDTVGTVSLVYPVVALSMNSTNVTCNGLANGEVWIVASGTAAPYSYLWNAGAVTNDSISGLSPGTFTVTVTDNNGCISTGSVSVTEPLILSLTKTSTDVSCFNRNNGTASITVTGGTLAYSYNWSSAQNTAVITGLAIGKYIITVTDQNNCTVIDSVQITQPTALSITTDSMNVTCNGLANGQVSVSTNGGSAPYSYTWNPGSTFNDTLKNVSAGIYSVTVNDAQGCTIIDDVTISQPLVLTVVMNNNGTGCGVNTGTADVTASGGNTPYTYSWSNGNTSSTINNLFKGSYAVTISDNLGCSITSTVAITEPDGIIISLSKTNISCNGANDGAATAVATGGNGTFIYSWTPGSSTSSTLSALAPGTYTINVVDATNSVCTAQSSVAITEPFILSSTQSQTGTLCFGTANGSSTVTVTGGSPNYTYSWSNGVNDVTSASTSTITNLTTQNYSVSITDGNGCTTSNSISITQPTLITAITSGQQASCGNSDGKVWIKASGGTGILTYVWSPVFSATDTLQGISSGQYNVIVTDANGCFKKDSATLLLSTIINTKLTQIPSTCFGSNDGQVIDTASGGSGTYIYNWSPGGSTNQNPNNLAPGMYTVTVSDATLVTCYKIDSILVTQPTGLNINPMITKTACTGNNNYVATANVTGGVPGYSYTWSFGGSSAVENNLSPGTYVLQVQDSNGCDTAAIFSITGASAPFILPPSVVNPKCNFPNGSIAISIFGGANPYTYNWSPSVSTSDSAKNVGPGIYTLTVTDAYNCTNTRTITVASSTLPPNLTTSSNPAGCFGASSGSATAAAQAGSPPYAFSWTPSGLTTATISGQPSGTYTIVVTDSKSCTATGTAAISEPTAVAFTTSSTDASCSTNNGSASVNPAGGTPGYTYNWSTGSTAQTITNVPAGNYGITVTDNNGCSKTSIAIINTTFSFTATINVIENVLCFNNSTGIAVANVTGGTPAYTYSWSNGSTNATANSLKAGAYALTVTDQNGCTSTQATNIAQPADSMIGIITVTNPMCGTNNGSISIAASGGTPGYTYVWSNGSTTTSLSVLTAGTYSVTVTDNNGCSINTSAVLMTMPGITFNLNAINTTCAETTDGKIKITPTSGTPGYIYNWSNGANTDSIINLSNGSYFVTINDASGCQTITSVVITFANPTPVADFSYTPATPVRPEKEIFFTDLSTTGSLLAWNFGEQDPYANTSTLSNPSHIYYYIDTYCVSLVASNTAGCNSKTEKCIEVYADTLFIPNVFSPNGDGVNDLFFVKTLGMKVFEFQIFDRWGLIMFQGGSTSKIQWDGKTASGVDVPDGTYFYVYNGESLKNKKYQGSGFLQLIRGK